MDRVGLVCINNHIHIILNNIKAQKSYNKKVSGVVVGLDMVYIAYCKFCSSPCSQIPTLWDLISNYKLINFTHFMTLGLRFMGNDMVGVMQLLMYLTTSSYHIININISNHHILCTIYRHLTTIQPVQKQLKNKPC